MYTYAGILICCVSMKQVDITLSLSRCGIHDYHLFINLFVCLSPYVLYAMPDRLVVFCVSLSLVPGLFAVLGEELATWNQLVS